MGRENEDNQHISSLYHPETIAHRQRRFLKPSANRAMSDYYADDYLDANSLTNRSKRHQSNSSNNPSNKSSNLGRLWKNYPF